MGREPTLCLTKLLARSKRLPMSNRKNQIRKSFSPTLSVMTESADPVCVKRKSEQKR